VIYITFPFHWVGYGLTIEVLVRDIIHLFMNPRSMLNFNY
jgi:hypothetical protein